jgi:flagellar basal body rod protein FlgC
VGYGDTLHVTAIASPSFGRIEPLRLRSASGRRSVAAPNVDLAGEVVEALVARYSFAFNAKVMRTASDMTKSLLDVTA